MYHAAFCRTIVPDGLMKNGPLPANPPDPFSVDELWLYGGMSYEQNNAYFMFEVHRLAQVFAEAGAVSIILSWCSLVSDQRHHRAADDDRIPRVHVRYTITVSPPQRKVSLLLFNKAVLSMSFCLRLACVCVSLILL